MRTKRKKEGTKKRTRKGIRIFEIEDPRGVYGGGSNSFKIDYLPGTSAPNPGVSMIIQFDPLRLFPAL